MEDKQGDLFGVLGYSPYGRVELSENVEEILTQFRIEPDVRRSGNMKYHEPEDGGNGYGETPKNKRDIKYRYSEDKFLAEVVDYVASTYQGHYVGGGQYQTVDIWNTLGSASTTCRDTAIKYLMRYGKKGGNNKKDLLKAIHYIILLNHFTQELTDDETYR
jgi:hypothetical protein